jgi:ATP-dependent helicase HrpA
MDLYALIARALVRNQESLRKDLARLARLPQESAQAKDEFSRLKKRVHASLREVRRREKTLPPLNYPANLPIVARREEIVAAIRRSPVVVITGETGSGKTTQIPKMCLEAGRGTRGVVACTQPRRVAAVTVARRIAEETGQEPGESVGYKIRFTEKGAPDPHIKIMTDGILLAEAQTSPLLSRYDTIIVDEAHERSLNIDFTLGIVKRLLQKRADLKLIITSATIDAEKFSRAFDNAPVIEVSGRLFPVRAVYDPPGEDDSGEETGHVEHAARTVSDIVSGKFGRPGDVLVFMPTENDIRETVEILSGKTWPGARILPLYARLPAQEQARVFDSAPGMKIVVATNVAETSLTIPGIRYVVDTGLARISQYNPRSRTTSLPVAKISRASADQRMGRAGRVEAGVCVRLYAEEDYQNRPRYTPPEILRANLAEVILRMTALGLGSPLTFGFVDPPTPKAVHDGHEVLLELSAIRVSGPEKQNEERHVLTPMGRLMARMPLDPRISRILMEARSEGCLAQAMVLAAYLSIMDPRERPPDKEAAADQAHAVFVDKNSDFVTALNIWRAWHTQRARAGSENQMKNYAKEKFLSYRRMREWQDVHGQITAILEDEGLLAPGARPEPADLPVPGPERGAPLYAAVHRAVASGYLSNIAMRKEQNTYTAARGREAFVFPGSGLHNKGVKWLVAAEVVETSRLFLRTAAAADPAWFEELGGHLCARHYTEPRFDPKRGEVVAVEHVTLYGLPVAPGRSVSFGPVNPDAATGVFLQSALVEGELPEALPFLVHNQEVVRKVREMEDRLRRRDLLLGQEHRLKFYEERLPEVYSVEGLKSIIRDRGGDRFLRMCEADVMAASPEPGRLARFPKRMPLSAGEFPVRYRFDPGSALDGVTVRIPRHVASDVDPAGLDWVVPGLLPEKVSLLLKGLSKEHRRRLVPVNQTVERILPLLKPGQGSLLGELSRVLHEDYGVSVPHSAWRTDLLPGYLTARVSVVGPDGREVAAGRDPSLLSRLPEAKAPEDLEKKVRERWETGGLLAWNMEMLPESVPIDFKRPDSHRLHLAFVPEGEAVAVRAFQDPVKAREAHRRGVARLFELHFGREARLLRRTMDLQPGDKPLAARHGGAQAVEDQAFRKVWEELFGLDIRTRTEFLAKAAELAPRMGPLGMEKTALVREALAAFHRTGGALKAVARANAGNRQLRELVARLEKDISALLPDNFVTLYDNMRLRHLPRYLAAMAQRAEKAAVDWEKESARAAVAARYMKRVRELATGLGPGASAAKREALEDLYWMVEEFKVSLFAQTLGTACPVSEKRLDRLAEELERMG